MHLNKLTYFLLGGGGRNVRLSQDAPGEEGLPAGGFDPVLDVAGLQVPQDQVVPANETAHNFLKPSG